MSDTTTTTLDLDELRGELNRLDPDHHRATISSVYAGDLSTIGNGQLLADNHATTTPLTLTTQYILLDNNSPHTPPDTDPTSITILYQDKPEYINNDLHRRNKARGWKTTIGAIAEARKIKQLRIINEELLGHSYTKTISVALKVEKSEKELKDIYTTIYKAIYKHKASFCWDIHATRENLIGGR